jgi:hypothetical protein
MRHTVSRVAGIVVVLGIAAAFTVASHAHGWSHMARVAAAYSPAHLADGRVWTLPLSALLLGHPKMIGPTSVMFALLFLPYALVRGLGRTLVTGLAGHIVSTLVIAAWALPAAAFGSVVATQVVHTADYGASAFLAACAGGLAVVITRRSRVLGLVLLALVVAYFTDHLVSVHQVAANVADVEHLVALGTGALVEWRIFVLPPTSRRSSCHPQPARA